MLQPSQIRKDHIVYLGETGFPHGLGAVQRMILVARALVFAGVKVTVVCRKGVVKKYEEAEITNKGVFEGIDYQYTSSSTYRPRNFFKRNLDKLKGMFGEYVYLRRLKKDNNISAAFISSMNACHVMRYKIYSIFIGFPIILNFVELGSAMQGRDNLFTRLNDYIFDHLIIKVVDGALPISEKLMNYYLDCSSGKPSLKLPILCDFEKFELGAGNNDKIEFLYCGAASYFELVDFVLNTFDILEDLGKQVVLKLILGGDEQEINHIKNRIEDARNKDKIELITNVKHAEIPQFYSRATALLIPLRPTLQDEARFPHKIGEYLASGKPMITTAFGEIKHYDFIDQENVLIAEDYQVDVYAKKLRFVLEHPDISRAIGLKGREMGMKNFDYKKHGQRLKQYVHLFTGESSE